MKKISAVLWGGLLIAGLASADTIVPGGNVSGTWTAAGSPYLVMGEILVPSNQTLTIQPGVQVIFQGHYALVVNGTLQAVGTESDSILFTAADPDSGWGGTQFVTGSSGALTYCTIQYGRHIGTAQGSGIHCFGSSPVISHCTISHNLAIQGGGIYCGQASPTIQYCTITQNSAGNGGGICCNQANPTINYCTISLNSAVSLNGGGIECYNSSPTISYCTITGNWTTLGDGGGIYSSNNISIRHSLISANTAFEDGGGIYFVGVNGLLKDVRMTANTAGQRGGGIYFMENASQVFSTTDRCNIYLNQASIGEDFYAEHTVNVTVDTFTVMFPTNYHATPIGNFTFDIWHSVLTQQDADLYVSPDGDNANSGLSWAEPLRNVYYALSIIRAEGIDPHTIYLAQGTYSPLTNDEQFPLSFPEYVSLQGSDENATILDAGRQNRVINCWSAQGITIADMTIQNGFSGGGGGIFCYRSDPVILNCIIRNDSVASSSGARGGGMYCYDSNPTISHCTIEDNYSASSGGGLELGDCDSVNISYCTITGNQAEQGGGGLVCYYAQAEISYCTISGNSSPLLGGGMYLSSSSPVIQFCTISGNLAETNGGGIMIGGGNPTILNCTISDNAAQSLGGGIIIYYGDSSLTIKNTIVEGNMGQAGIYFIGGISSLVSYCDVANNQGGNFAGGFIPPGLGQIVTVNANGDSCDNHYNIYLDPLFVNPGGGDYHLQAGSPCIDAGDPASPRDPDLTVADMGAFYFDHSTPVQVVLFPHDPPITIPAGGGSFQFDLLIQNNDSANYAIDIQTTITPPGGAPFPVLVRNNVPLPVGASISRPNLTQFVPGSAAPGLYAYTAIVRNHRTWQMLDQDDFPFTKLSGDDGPAAHNRGWDLLGWGDDAARAGLPLEFALLGNFPNPFNSVTVIRYELLEARHVKLEIFDPTGRLVEALTDGERPAGDHEVTWNAGNLPSGIYLCHFQAGEFRDAKKMILVK